MSDLTDIIDEVQDNADTTSTRDTDAQVTRYIQAAGRQIHRWVVAKNSDGRLIRESETIATVAEQDAYDLSSLDPTFLKAQTLWYIESASVDPVELLPIVDIRDFGRGFYWLHYATAQLGALRWRIINNDLYLYPKPKSVGNLRLDYTPAYTDISASLPAYWPTQAWDYIVAYATSRVLVREESDPSYWLAIAGKLEPEIKHELSIGHQGRPSSVRRQSGILL